MSINIRVPGIISFIQYLWEPGVYTAPGQQPDPKKKPEYSCHGLFVKGGPSVQTIQGAIVEAAKSGYGEKTATSPGWQATLTALQAQNLICLHDGDHKTWTGYAGHMYVRANVKPPVKPPIRDLDGKTDITEASGKIYSGAQVMFYLSIWAQTKKSGFGERINCQLRGVQYMAEGIAFGGGGTKAEDSEFEALTPAAPADMNFAFQ